MAAVHSVLSGECRISGVFFFFSDFSQPTDGLHFLPYLLQRRFGTVEEKEDGFPSPILSGRREADGGYDVAMRSSSRWILSLISPLHTSPRLVFSFPFAPIRSKSITITCHTACVFGSLCLPNLPYLAVRLCSSPGLLHPFLRTCFGRRRACPSQLSCYMLLCSPCSLACSLVFVGLGADICAWPIKKSLLDFWGGIIEACKEISLSRIYFMNIIIIIISELGGSHTHTHTHTLRLASSLAI